MKFEFIKNNNIIYEKKNGINFEIKERLGFNSRDCLVN